MKKYYIIFIMKKCLISLILIFIPFAVFAEENHNYKSKTDFKSLYEQQLIENTKISNQITTETVQSLKERIVSEEAWHQIFLAFGGIFLILFTGSGIIQQINVLGKMREIKELQKQMTFDAEKTREIRTEVESIFGVIAETKSKLQSTQKSLEEQSSEKKLITREEELALKIVKSRPIEQLNSIHLGILYSAGSAAQKNKDFEEALKLYEMCLSRDPNWFLARIGKGHVLLAQKKFSEAMDCVDKILGLSPNYFDARFLKSQILSAMGDYAASESIATSLIDELINAPTPHYTFLLQVYSCRGWYRILLKNLDGADKDLELAGFYHYAALINAGHIKILKNKDIVGAQKIFEEALAKNHDNTIKELHDDLELLKNIYPENTAIFTEIKNWLATK